MILQTGLEDFIQSSIYDFKNMSTIKKFWVVESVNPRVVQGAGGKYK